MPHTRNNTGEFPKIDSLPLCIIGIPKNDFPPLCIIGIPNPCVLNSEIFFIKDYFDKEKGQCVKWRAWKNVDAISGVKYMKKHIEKTNTSETWCTKQGDTWITNEV